jgi:uncharacterized membrane protein YdfJ with MMPL/SSD domain
MSQEIVNGLDELNLNTRNYFGMSVFKLIFVSGIVAIIGIYIGLLLFGDNSLKILFELQEYQSYLEDEIVRLKESNAELQKEYFELTKLDPDS